LAHYNLKIDTHMPLERSTFGTFTTIIRSLVPPSNLNKFNSIAHPIAHPYKNLRLINVL
jgi:hypothetical protein